MQVSRIKFLNIMGLENLVLEPGKFTVVRGPNASGKTSIASGINSVLDGGAHEAKLLRNGAQEGEVVFEIDDGAMTIEKSISATGSTVKVRDENGKVVPKPVSVIQTLLNKASANPISFFTANKEDRKKILLKAMPITADPARLEKIAGQKIHATGNAWDVIATVYKQIYSERTATNNSAREKRNSINQVELALPKSSGAVVDMESITTELQKVDAVKDAKFKAIDNKLTNVRAEHQAKTKERTEAHQIEVDAIREQIKALESKIFEKQKTLSAEITMIDKELQENEARAQAARNDRTAEWKDARGALDLQMKEARSIIEQEGRIKQSRDNIKLWAKEAEELEEVSAQQTASLEALDAYRLELMASLPITGLEFRGDDIFYNGVVWEGLNEAKRMDLAFEIALLQCGDVPFLFVDGAERLDGKNFEMFKAKAIASKAQCMMFAVNHDPNAKGLTTEVYQ